MILKTYLISVILIMGMASCSTNKSSDPDFKYDKIQATQIDANRVVKDISPITLSGMQGVRFNNNATPVKNQPQSPVVSSQPNSNTSTANNPLNPGHGQPGHRCDIAVGASLSSATGTRIQNQLTTISPATKSNPLATNKSLNPAHGQPGHRCDIAIGAPLNSPIGASGQNQSTTISPAAKSITLENNKSLNPAHGQPGHRCDIAVGAPLNSPPGATTKMQTVTTTSSPKSASTNKTTAPGMNPPHGEPGHRCDIAVGSSISQPIVKTDNQIISNNSTAIKDSTKK